MKIEAFVNRFIHPSYFEKPIDYRRARLFVRACLLTSIFSLNYILTSIYFEFTISIYLMVFNAVGYLLLPFLAKTKTPISILGNLYVGIGAIAIVILIYFSGGMWSAVFPWMIAIPLLGLLIVNRMSGVIWGVFSFLVMLWFSFYAYQGEDFPVAYNPEMKTIVFIVVLLGLLLITFAVALVFEGIQKSALDEVEEKNRVLNVQKMTISDQTEALMKNVEDRNYLIRILAHDLKNPLSNIATLTALMEKDERYEQDESLVTMLSESARNAQDLINRVMEMIKAERKEVTVDIEELNIGELLQKSVSMFNEIAKKKDINIVLNDQNLDVLIKTDGMYLSLIFENLISNAVKFSNPETKVEIRVEKFEHTLHVLIQDQGPGIHPEEQKELFKPFAKLTSIPTGGESSSGLGLSLVKRYAELIESKVWFDKDYIEGARIVVELKAVK